jgi:hypothetical protein
MEGSGASNNFNHIIKRGLKLNNELFSVLQVVSSIVLSLWGPCYAQGLASKRSCNWKRRGSCSRRKDATTLQGKSTVELSAQTKRIIIYHNYESTYGQSIYPHDRDGISQGEKEILQQIKNTKSSIPSQTLAYSYNYAYQQPE